jgi:hypothetical protein
LIKRPRVKGTILTGGGFCGFARPVAVSPFRRFDLYSFAAIPPPREIPLVREAAALGWLDRIYRTVPLGQKDAVIGIAGAECEPCPVRTQFCVLLDKLVFVETQILADSNDVRVREPNKTGPPATVGAALAKIADGRHVIVQSLGWLLIFRPVRATVLNCDCYYDDRSGNHDGRVAP